MDGVLNIRKPAGMTSHDVVARLRRILGERRIGHAGTLDPAAEGVLPICIGRATRLSEYLSDLGKTYRAEVTFGAATTTLDAEGEVVAEADASHLTRADLEAVLPRFTGEIQQVPPMVSAVKVGGRKLYELARQGIEVERAPRRVTIYRLELLEFRPGPRAVARLEVACSKGTYVRALAADLGAALGVPAHLSHLVRTAAGPFRLEDAVTLEAVAAHGAGPYLVPMAAAVAHLPRLCLDAAAAAGVRHGRAPRPPRGWQPPDPGRPLALIGPDGELVALAEFDPGPPARIRLRKVLTG